MKAKIDWKFGGDSVTIQAGDEQMGYDGGNHGPAFQCVLKDARLGPKQRGVLLSSDRWWSYTVEMPESVLDDLRQAQVAIDAEYQEWHENDIARANEKDLIVKLYTDKAIVAALKNFPGQIRVLQEKSIASGVLLDLEVGSFLLAESDGKMRLTVGNRHIAEEYFGPLFAAIRHAVACA